LWFSNLLLLGGPTREFLKTVSMSQLFAGVDLGGTTISAALATGDGKIVAERELPTEAYGGPDHVLARIGDLIATLSDQVGQRPVAVGMGCPGLVDVERGVTRFFPNLPTQWRDVPAAERLQARLGVPVRLLNDVRAATLGELTYGRGRSVGTMAFFSLGTGVGGGLVIDGRLRLGPLGSAGELGHQTIVPDGPLCGCGNHGCLEALVSGPALVGDAVRMMLAGQAPRLHLLTGGDAGRVTPREIATAARDGDIGAAAVITRAAVYLGVGVANVVTIVHPQLVVLGGGVAALGDLLLDPVRRIIRERVRMFPPDDVRVELSALGDRAGVLGAVALAKEGVKSEV
jgi:glucokinase